MGPGGPGPRSAGGPPCTPPTPVWVMRGPRLPKRSDDAKCAAMPPAVRMEPWAPAPLTLNLSRGIALPDRARGSAYMPRSRHSPTHYTSHFILPIRDPNPSSRPSSNPPSHFSPGTSRCLSSRAIPPYEGIPTRPPGHHRTLPRIFRPVPPVACPPALSLPTKGSQPVLQAIIEPSLAFFARYLPLPVLPRPCWVMISP